MPHSFPKAQVSCGAGDLVAGVPRLKIKSPAGGKDRQRHNAGFPLENYAVLGTRACSVQHPLQGCWRDTPVDVPGCEIRGLAISDTHSESEIRRLLLPREFRSFHEYPARRHEARQLLTLRCN